MKNLLFLVCIILISCNQEVDNEVVIANSVKAIPYKADTTILIQGGLLDVSISYRKGNSKVDMQLKWSQDCSGALQLNLKVYIPWPAKSGCAGRQGRKGGGSRKSSIFNCD